LPRRLGEDPLARARDERAKAAQVSALVAPDSEGQAAVSSPGIRSSSRTSYNDVFFQRRAEGVQQQAAEVRATPETPEISEISEIPEIREVAAAPVAQATPDVALAQVNAVSESAQAAEVKWVAPVSIIEEVVAKLNATAPVPAARVAAVTEARSEPASLPTTSQAADDKVEPQKMGGFFKRLFGKFK
jgi:hypothetical protein